MRSRVKKIQTLLGSVIFAQLATLEVWRGLKPRRFGYSLVLGREGLDTKKGKWRPAGLTVNFFAEKKTKIRRFVLFSVLTLIWSKGSTFIFLVIKWMLNGWF